jgi:hypothetical membrane protein
VTARVLLSTGVAAVVVWGVVLRVVGARRPGYDARYHTGSELELGPGGWIMRANFFLLGAGLVVFSIGIRRALESDVAAALLGVAGVALALAGVFTPDPVRGFPPGASSRTGRALTTTAKLHDLVGPVMTAALSGACVAVAVRLPAPWAVYSLATGVAGLVMTVWLVSAYRRDAANTGRVQRLLLATYGLWIVLLGVALAAGAVVA